MTTFRAELQNLQSWESCDRPDWMLWYAMRAGASHKDVVTCACRFARISLAHTDDPRVLACIETVEAWVRGEATDADVVAARSAARSAAYATAASAAAWSSAAAAN